MPPRERPLPPLPPAWHSELTSVGVTGTNGKTTTTTYVAAALAKLAEPVFRSTTIGLFVGQERRDVAPSYTEFLRALEICRTRGGKYAAIELSSHALALGFIRAWPCRVGIFTNLTRDHLDAHKTPEHYLASKAQLFMQLPSGGSAVLNGCDAASALLAEVIPEGVGRVHYGVRTRGTEVAELDLRAEQVQPTWTGTRIEVSASSRLGPVPRVLEVRAIGDVYAENALAALAGAIAAGVPADLAAEAIAAAAPPPGRFEVVHEKPWIVIDYAHTPDALARTLRTARALCRGRLVVVFGAGGERDREKRPLMGKASVLADRIIITSDNPRSEDPVMIAGAIREGIGEHSGAEQLLDRAEAIRTAVRDAARDDVVVIAGKGHESEQHAGGEVRPFSDRDVVRAAL